MPPFKFFSKPCDTTTTTTTKMRSKEEDQMSPLALAIKNRKRGRLSKDRELASVATKFFIGPGRREFVCQGKDANNLTLLQALLGGRKRRRREGGSKKGSGSGRYYWWSDDDEKGGKIVKNLLENNLESLLWGLYAYFINILGKRKIMAKTSKKIVGEIDKKTGRFCGVRWAGKEYANITVENESGENNEVNIVETIAGQRDFTERTNPEQFLNNICNLLLPKGAALSRFDGDTFLVDDFIPFIRVDDKTTQRLKEKEVENEEEEDIFVLESDYAVLHHTHSRKFRNSYKLGVSTTSSSSSSSSSLSNIFKRALKDTTFNNVVYSPPIIYPRLGNPLYLSDVVVNYSSPGGGCIRFIHYVHSCNCFNYGITTTNESIWKCENWMNSETQTHEPPINSSEIIFSIYKP